MRVAFATLGCKTNQYETSLMYEDLRGEYEIIPFNKEADVYIINTCTVTRKADYQSRQLVRRAIKINQKAKVIVSGCYAEREPDELKSLGAYEVIGNRGKNQIALVLNDLMNGKDSHFLKTGFLQNEDIRCKATVNPGRTRAFLKIQDGCNYNCSYCIVPVVRGKSRSASLRNAYEEVKALVDTGYCEIVLTGIQLGAYGKDLVPESNLAELLKELSKIEGLFRLRLSSIEPQDVTPPLIELIKSDPKICRYLHIPLQSGDDGVLVTMGRGYTASYYKALIMSLVSEIPDIGIGTDVIVGFPGETEMDFLNTYNLLKDLPLSYFHIFSFSERPDTSAYGISDNVPTGKIKERNRLLKLLSEKNNIAFKSKMIGKQVNVLVEDKIDPSGYSSGLADNYLRLHLNSLNDLVGRIIRLKVTGYSGDLLLAEEA